MELRTKKLCAGERREIFVFGNSGDIATDILAPPLSLSRTPPPPPTMFSPVVCRAVSRLPAHIGAVKLRSDSAYTSISKILWILMFRLPRSLCHWEIFTRTRGKGHNISNFILFSHYYCLHLQPSTLPVYPSFIYSSFHTTTIVTLKQWNKLHFYTPRWHYFDRKWLLCVC
jgi:hypothetical protein